MEAISSKPKGGVPVTLEGVTVRAAGRVLLDDNSLEIPAGKITVIVGGSGAGKSVLLRILSGLIPRSGYPLSWSGSIRYGDNDVSSGADGRVGIVFQQFALFDELSVTANVQFAIDHRRDPRVPPAQNASDWLKELRVPTGVPVSALSGGQKQRLAIARTLAADPEIILYDEPTSGLDAASGRQVAELIQRTQLAHRRTSIVVTHDYETLLNIADHVLLLDASRQQMISIPRNEWSRVPEKLQPVQQSDNSGETISTPSSGRRIANQMLGATDEFVSTSGSAIVALLRLPIDILPAWRRPMWGIRFTLHYLKLVAGPSAWVYLVMSGLIVGFTSTYFTFRFLPHQLYTKPLLLEDLLAAIGFALYRVLVPVMATVLIAARCGAATSADVGVKRYGMQVEALHTLGIRPSVYLLTPILFAFLIGTPLLEYLAFESSRLISLVSFSADHPDLGPYYWQMHFSRMLREPGQWWFEGTGWLMLKNTLCGLGVAVISYYRGLRPKQSASDVSDGITSTVLWSTLYVLLVHFLVALFEF